MVAKNKMSHAVASVKQMYLLHLTVTVTEALVLHPLLEDRGRITESIRILVPQCL